jgi:hypothetical protein
MNNNTPKNKIYELFSNINISKDELDQRTMKMGIYPLCRQRIWINEIEKVKR